MDISPQRVRTAEFRTVKRGLDPDEVREFLGEVATELERAQNQSTAMEARARAAVARLQEISESGATSPIATSEPTGPPEPLAVPVNEAETISRTLVLAQRTADSTVAEAQAEAERIERDAGAEAAKTLDSTREMSARLLDEAREEARRAGEAERLNVKTEVESLQARRDFLESDVDHLERHLTEERSRLREAATTLIELTERVPGGLGEVRRPLLSASYDDTPTGTTIDPLLDGPVDEPVDDDESEPTVPVGDPQSAEYPGSAESSETDASPDSSESAGGSEPSAFTEPAAAADLDDRADTSGDEPELAFDDAPADGVFAGDEGDGDDGDGLVIQTDIAEDDRNPFDRP